MVPCVMNIVAIQNKMKEVEGETNRRDLVIIKMSSRLGPTEQEGYVLITRIVSGILDGSG